MPMPSATKTASSTAHRGARISGSLLRPMISGVPQANIHEGICVTQSTQPRGDVIDVADDSE